MITLDLDDDQADRDAILLALAILSIDRPGWHDYLGRIAAKFSISENLTGRGTFERFRALNADRRTQPVDAEPPLVGWSERRDKSPR